MRGKQLFMLCLGASVIAVSGGAVAAETPPARAKVALVDAIELPEAMEDTRVRLRELIEKEIRDRGMDVAVPPAAASCWEPACLADIARGTGATDVILARGGRTDSRDYHVELSLWQGAGGEVVPASAQCSFCTGPQMAEAVAKAANPLLDRIHARQLVTAVLPPTMPTRNALPPAQQPSDNLKAAHGRPIFGWSLVGLGAVTTVAGAFLWNRDGRGADCVGSSCRSTYHTQNEGIALVAAGVVGMGVGLWLAIDPFGDRNVVVGVGPSAAMLVGRF